MSRMSREAAGPIRDVVAGGRLGSRPVQRWWQAGTAAVGPSPKPWLPALNGILWKTLGRP